MRALVITNMYPTPKYPSFGTFVEEQVKSLKNEGVDIDVLFVNGIKGKINYVKGIFRMWGILLTHRYDLIHAHYVFSGMVARFQFFYPIILTHHGSQVFQGWQAPLCRWVSPLMDSVIVVSQEMKIKGNLKKSQVIPCGIDLELFKPLPREQARKELNLPEDKKLVLFCGEYFRPIKRFDIVRKAMWVLQQKEPDAELVVCSKKPLSVVPKYMSACDVLVLVSDGEGSPMVIKEAMACNLPVVAVPAGDIPDVIGGTEGCFICSQDPYDVAEKLDLALHGERRTNGREKIRHMEIGAISRQIIALYNSVLYKKKKHGISRLYFWQRNENKAL
jgi:teichuronic acid biosynthesis glycosyltransferase TuaC